jgi:hypothetical protein
MKSRRNEILLIVILMSVFIIVAILANQAPHAYSPATSSYNNSPFGLKAARLALQQCGMKAQKWQKDWSRLSSTETGLFIVAFPSDLSFRNGSIGNSLKDVKKLSKWVEGGNDLLLLLSDFQSRSVIGETSFEEDFLKKLKIPDSLYKTRSKKKSLRDLPWNQRSDLSLEKIAITESECANVKNIFLEKCEGFSLPSETQSSMATVLLQTEDRAHLVRIPHGKGTIYLGSSPSLIDNQYVGKTDNFQLFLNIARQHNLKSVYFDEYLHGYASSYQLSELTRQPPVLSFMLQSIALVIFFSIFVERRVGQARPLRRDQRRSILEYTQSLGNLYRQAGVGFECLRDLFDYARVELALRLGLDRKAPTASIETQLMDSASLKEAWTQTNEILNHSQTNRRISMKEMLHGVRQIQQMRKQL